MAVLLDLGLQGAMSSKPRPSHDLGFKRTTSILSDTCGHRSRRFLVDLFWLVLICRMFPNMRQISEFFIVFHDKFKMLFVTLGLCSLGSGAWISVHWGHRVQPSCCRHHERLCPHLTANPSRHVKLHRKHMSARCNTGCHVKTTGCHLVKWCGLKPRPSKLTAQPVVKQAPAWQVQHVCIMHTYLNWMTGYYESICIIDSSLLAQVPCIALQPRSKKSKCMYILYIYINIYIHTVINYCLLLIFV